MESLGTVKAKILFAPEIREYVEHEACKVIIKNSKNKCLRDIFAK